MAIARIHNQLPLSAKWFNNQRLNFTRAPESWREEGQRSRDFIDVRDFRQQKSGRRGIRTPGRVTPSPVFKTGAFDQTQPSVLAF